jgi:NAD(P)-dependent dehydrogenase (short-subunit alcohol dehydrogenase family)
VASELAATGVRVNAVCPTFVDTALTERTIRQIVETTGRNESESEQLVAAQSPLGRLLEPREVAEAVVFLASPAAAAINGQALVIDGGGIRPDAVRGRTPARDRLRRSAGALRAAWGRRRIDSGGPRELDF